MQTENNQSLPTQEEGRALKVKKDKPIEIENKVNRIVNRIGGVEKIHLLERSKTKALFKCFMPVANADPSVEDKRAKEDKSRYAKKPSQNSNSLINRFAIIWI